VKPVATFLRDWRRILIFRLVSLHSWWGAIFPLLFRRPGLSQHGAESTLASGLRQGRTGTDIDRLRVQRMEAVKLIFNVIFRYTSTFGLRLGHFGLKRGGLSGQQAKEQQRELNFHFGLPGLIFDTL
jgi:uncharacterized membrane protein YcfT